ncbi:hypothetical protein P170DRAFT_475432 [Aspergillus steynii IBT 23096]|uniref:Core Histone H2A/H2B/H3 domain-containing protein n=1 Tax=Aspergillus steynii IBT 23096 TaxID=1392250 RepID=A0A2I2G8C3_9EURO|nr:uncharacterized protein P170DRAFT_475432 [Aspergillus steynii IBT 23096]PLB49115.1 hypothetical protein P170DRAFT_475432 [Aspergillus steynii IBT 23096]
MPRTIIETVHSARTGKLVSRKIFTVPRSKILHRRRVRFLHKFRRANQPSSHLSIEKTAFRRLAREVMRDIPEASGIKFDSLAMDTIQDIVETLVVR